MKFKSTLLSTVFSAVAIPAVYAADAVVYTEPVPVAVVDTFSWTGGYIGLNAGYAGDKFKHPFTSTSVPQVNAPESQVMALRAAGGSIVNSGSADITASGFAGGVQAGYNWQFDNNFIVGIEADFQGSNMKGEIKLHQDDMQVKAGTKVNWFGTVRARLGYTPVERFMVYATGGLAYGKVKSYADASNGYESESLSKSKTKAGWTVGAGAEYAFTNNWTLKSEYLYTDLGKTTLANFSDDWGTHFKLKNDVSFHTVRVGLNYKF
ncbi:outer membrane protein [Paenochrobactrum sp. BZR 588]|uniref:outer membrane protein n=1 Tax=unclassified Paenochrobactrum TaxID=2639760 RepID=UPI003854A354